MSEFGNEYWSVKLPNPWVGQHDSRLSSICDPNGVGALQISTATKETNVTDDDLNDFASEHIDEGAKHKRVALGDFSGFTFSYGVDNEYWRQWFLRSGQLAMFVTYNCELDHKGIEDTAIESILSTLRSK